MSRMLIAAALLLSWVPCGLAQEAAPASPAPPAPNTAEAARRGLWLADEGRFVRRWLVLGPMKHAQADEVAPLNGTLKLTGPGQGTAQEFTSGEPLSWRAMGTYGDLLDGFGGMKDGEVGLALASVDRTAAGDALLLLGGNVRGVWVNGAWAGGGQDSSAFVID